MPKVIAVQEVTFFRLPEKVIGNEFWSLDRTIRQMLVSMKNGNDFDMESWKQAKDLIRRIDRAVERDSA